MGEEGDGLRSYEEFVSIGNDEARLNWRNVIPKSDDVLGHELGDDGLVFRPVFDVEDVGRQGGGVGRKVDADDGEGAFLIHESNSQPVAVTVFGQAQRGLEGFLSEEDGDMVHW